MKQINVDDEHDSDDSAGVDDDDEFLLNSSFSLAFSLYNKNLRTAERLVTIIF